MHIEWVHRSYDWMGAGFKIFTQYFPLINPNLRGNSVWVSHKGATLEGREQFSRRPFSFLFLQNNFLFHFSCQFCPLDECLVRRRDFNFETAVQIMEKTEFEKKRHIRAHLYFSSWNTNNIGTLQISSCICTHKRIRTYDARFFFLVSEHCPL